MRTTIDYGIDLGTTNSSIAFFNGTKAEIFKNQKSQELTPSVVSIDRKGALHVGLTAKNQLYSDPKNAYSKWKIYMGKSDMKFSFPNGKREMGPEELSSEVLKSLKSDVKRINRRGCRNRCYLCAS